MAKLRYLSATIAPQPLLNNQRKDNFIPLQFLFCLMHKHHWTAFFPNSSTHYVFSCALTQLVLTLNLLNILLPSFYLTKQIHPVQLFLLHLLLRIPHLIFVLFQSGISDSFFHQALQLFHSTHILKAPFMILPLSQSTITSPSYISLSSAAAAHILFSCDKNKSHIHGAWSPHPHSDDQLTHPDTVHSSPFYTPLLSCNLILWAILAPHQRPFFLLSSFVGKTRFIQSLESKK